MGLAPQPEDHPPLPLTVLEPPLLWTTVDDHGDGLALVVRGELSTKTAPALDSLLDALVNGRETLASIDLRHALVLPPAGERFLERWGAAPGHLPGLYRFPAVGDKGAFAPT